MFCRSDQLLFKTPITTLQIYHIIEDDTEGIICNIVRGVYCSLHPRVAFCSLVCLDKPQTNFKSSYYSQAIVKVTMAMDLYLN